MCGCGCVCMCVCVCVCVCVCSTCVSFEPRKGVCPELLSSERMHSFRQSRLLLISAPSRRVVRSLEEASAARSDPARSTRLSRPSTLLTTPLGPASTISTSEICRMACEMKGGWGSGKG